MGETKKRTTAVRKSITRKKKVVPTHEEIATRAYFIALEDRGGGDLDHWLRAERELAAV